MNKANVRTRKVQIEHQRRQAGDVQVPSLHLSGKWLEKHGIKIGETVAILECNGHLVIQPAAAMWNTMERRCESVVNELRYYKRVASALERVVSPDDGIERAVERAQIDREEL